jgi:hypothetical protein
VPERRLTIILLVPMLSLAGCGAGGHDGEPAARLPTVPTVAATDPGHRFPPALTDYRHGDDVFGVYLAVERSRSAPELAQAKEELRNVGYRVDEGLLGIDCDRGAREALGLAPGVDYVAVAVYFQTRQEAQQFVDAFAPGVVGTAQVTILCKDSGH